MAPRLRILSIDAFERPMRFARPFRFGAVIVAAAPQAFLRVRVDVEGIGTATGATAEMMMPRWFDKNPAKSPDETIVDLRASLVEAVRLYSESGQLDTAFGHHAAAYPRQLSWASERRLPSLVAAYGPALVDKAILDALLRAAGLDLARGLGLNLPGLDARLTPDLGDADVNAFLSRLEPLPSVALRHTVGLADPVEGEGGLADELAAARVSFLKIKLGGDLDHDLRRLEAIARMLDAHAPQARATLDANEQYDVERLGALVTALGGDRLCSMRDRLLYIEQPLDRAATFRAPLGAAADRISFIIDEADGTYDAFPRALTLGYRGVSSKACKGLYKSLLNAVRAQGLNGRDGTPGRCFLSAEDLTCQAGLAVQQDTALVALLGLAHAERNGHHYVDGFGPAPQDEAEAFARAHPDLYSARSGRLALDVASGVLPTASLFARPGFASGAEPDWASLTPLPTSAFEEFSA